MKFLSLIYGFAVFLRNKMYDTGILKSREVENVKIICIGNIVAGGSGKTPAVQYFAEKYINKNKKVGILSRGYKGKRNIDTMSVRDENEIKATVLEAGDEAYLHGLNLEIPVVVSKNRYNGAVYLRNNYNVDIIIMDDGFQHRKLKKNKNIVLIDATNPFGGYEYLPKGRLRESINELKRADEIIITKSNYVETSIIDLIKNKIVKYNKPISVAIYKEKCFYDYMRKNYKLDVIKDKKIMIFSSIANPKTFYMTVKKLKPAKIDEIKFNDHHLYSEEEMQEIYRESKNYDYVVTTEKDMAKINRKIDNLLILKMGFEIIEKK
ncbi:tetraacyldisaccharide 4'-kinase [Leptotrichia sp. OH3620_COT-345]|uniref:tetraacyldisaccharide 4'-kinase n=1 Tax=Leptotrichia sp. OH3620_COT-345 TaxID=2491048 RepID=UPI000F64DECA|nr:tetraacyldisaccharide 4'-kinase [Leptotrichia sp. OH3620_COT-345]RRD39467.1 tetraacyldisaccharide 4'-kinase [Leptotrichia sp. OH3620_COT-345]